MGRTFFVCTLTLVAVSGGLCQSGLASKDKHSDPQRNRNNDSDAHAFASLPVDVFASLPGRGPVSRFRSALGTDDLTALVLQYAMYDEDARETLEADPSLAHLYRKHQGGYPPAPGLAVSGAEMYAQVNGWYHRRENTEGAPAAFVSRRGDCSNDA